MCIRLCVCVRVCVCASAFNYGVAEGLSELALYPPDSYTRYVVVVVLVVGWAGSLAVLYTLFSYLVFYNFFGMEFERC